MPTVKSVRPWPTLENGQEEPTAEQIADAVMDAIYSASYAETVILEDGNGWAVMTSIESWEMNRETAPDDASNYYVIVLKRGGTVSFNRKDVSVCVTFSNEVKDAKYVTSIALRNTSRNFQIELEP